MPQTWGLGSAQLSCFGGIWSCSEDSELQWVTAESGLATVRWNEVKWRASKHLGEMAFSWKEKTENDGGGWGN